MGGSGSGGAFVYRTPAQLLDQVRKQEDKTSDVAFDTGLANVLGQLLGKFNARDTERARELLDELSELLGDELNGPFEHLYGGSVAKHTYVDGLSDVDSLVVIDDSELGDKKPKDALQRMRSVISQKLGEAATVSVGKMAVTLDYGDGIIIQLLPALRTRDGKFHVPSSRNENAWSLIDPRRFQQALTQRNGECNGKLVPTIKLAKAVMGQLPETRRLSGYHIEALAISAFRNYDGVKSTAAMLPTFFERAQGLVLKPIRDRTGQSVHVDGYLEGERSQEREVASHLLGRIARRMRNASAARSLAQWQALLGLDE